MKKRTLDTAKFAFVVHHRGLAQRKNRSVSVRRDSLTGQIPGTNAPRRRHANEQNVVGVECRSWNDWQIVTGSSVKVTIHNLLKTMNKNCVDYEPVLTKTTTTANPAQEMGWVSLYLALS